MGGGEKIKRKRRKFVNREKRFQFRILILLEKSLSRSFGELKPRSAAETDEKKTREPEMLFLFHGLNSLFFNTTIETDLTTLKLHYRTTTAILIMFSIILGARQLVGNPIDCVHIEDIPEDVMDTYCWIHLTYTVRSAFGKEVGKEVVAPGVAPAGIPKLDNTKTTKNDIQVYPFYQWVVFCLCFQVCTCSTTCVKTLVLRFFFLVDYIV